MHYFIKYYLKILQLKYQIKITYKKKILKTFKYTIYSTIIHSNKLFLINSIIIQRLKLTYIHLHNK